MSDFLEFYDWGEWDEYCEWSDDYSSFEEQAIVEAKEEWFWEMENETRREN